MSDATPQTPHPNPPPSGGREQLRPPPGGGRVGWGVTLALAVLLVHGTARAEPCERFELAPLAIGVRDGAIDRPRSACTGWSESATLAAQVLIDTPEFYGTLAASVSGDVTVVLRGLELEWRVRALDYRFAQNAVITADEISLGPIEFGVARSLRAGPRVVWTPFVRIEGLNTRIGYAELMETAAAGVVVSAQLRPRLVGHGRVMGHAWISGPFDDPTWRAAGLASGDVGWSARPWLAVLGGVELQAGWYRSGIDHALARVGVRFRKCLGTVDVGAAVPLFGAERADAILFLGLGRQL